jgi:hypothetical protein
MPAIADFGKLTGDGTFTLTPVTTGRLQKAGSGSADWWDPWWINSGECNEFGADFNG